VVEPDIPSTNFELYKMVTDYMLAERQVDKTKIAYTKEILDGTIA
jgi:hypothetical protein